MKIFLLFFLASVFLTGCSTTYQYESPKIAVLKTNGIQSDYALLSVRSDTALVVMDWKEWKADMSILVSLAQVIGQDSISKILRPYKGDITLGLDDVYNSLGQDLVAAAIAVTVGIPLVTWYFIYNGNPPLKQLLLSSEADREFLRSIALYPNKEPDEMQYIK